MTSDEFIATTLRNPANKIIVDELFHLALPDAWLVSGCLVQTVWNVVTGRAVDHGIADYDVFYFDRDTSWEAEDDVIRRLNAVFRKLRVKVEPRNQARVHLWYPDKHGLPYPPLACSTDGIDRFLTKNTRIGLRRTREGYDIYAPDGFEDAAKLIVRPNPGPKFFGGELRGESCALEDIVAGGDGVGGLRSSRRRPGPIATNANCCTELGLRRASTICRGGYRPRPSPGRRITSPRRR